MNRNTIARFKVAFFACPLVLRAYALFAVIVTATDMILTFCGPQAAREAITPIVGWVPSMPYMFTIFSIYYLILVHPQRGRLGVVAPLLIYASFGIGLIFIPNHPDFSNPYLMVSPWRSVWTVVIPILWVLALYSPGVSFYCRSSSSENGSQPTAPANGRGGHR